MPRPASAPLNPPPLTSTSDHSNQSSLDDILAQSSNSDLSDVHAAIHTEAWVSGAPNEVILRSMVGFTSAAGDMYMHNHRRDVVLTRSQLTISVPVARAHRGGSIRPLFADHSRSSSPMLARRDGESHSPPNSDKSFSQRRAGKPRGDGELTVIAVRDIIACQSVLSASSNKECRFAFEIYTFARHKNTWKPRTITLHSSTFASCQEWVANINGLITAGALPSRLAYCNAHRHRSSAAATTSCCHQSLQWPQERAGDIQQDGATVPACGGGAGHCVDGAGRGSH